MGGKKKFKKKTIVNNTSNNLVSNTSSTLLSYTTECRYIGVDEELVRKNIFAGNKILTLDYGYRYDGIINSFSRENDGEYVYVDFGDKQIAKSHFENVSNQKMNINDLAIWICEKGDYYTIHAEFVPPF